jgi:hypothetical protein
VKWFISRFPAVRIYTAWNEPNAKPQPTRYPSKHYPGNGPDGAAMYTVTLQRYCQPNVVGNCLVVAGDFANHTYRPGVPAPKRTGNSYTKARYQVKYQNDYKSDLQTRDQNHTPAVPAPTVWSYHAYTDVECMWASPTETDTFLNNLPAGVNAWLLEQGAIHAKFGSDASADVSQSKRVAYLVDQLANPRPRIERLYYYFYWAPYPP